MLVKSLLKSDNLQSVQVETNCQVLSFKVYDYEGTSMDALKKTFIKVSNQEGILVPRMSLHNLFMLNLDVQEVFVYTKTSTEMVIGSVALANDGYLKPTIFVDIQNPVSGVDVLSYSDSNIPLEFRKYVSYGITSPTTLPKNSLVLIPRESIETIEMKNQIMSISEFDLISSDRDYKQVINKFFHDLFDFQMLLINTGEEEIRLTPKREMNSVIDLYSMTYNYTRIGQKVASKLNEIENVAGTTGEVIIDDLFGNKIEKMSTAVLVHPVARRQVAQVLANNLEVSKKSPLLNVSDLGVKQIKISN